jgi:hypothetical protein
MVCIKKLCLKYKDELHKLLDCKFDCITEEVLLDFRSRFKKSEESLPEETSKKATIKRFYYILKHKTFETNKDLAMV